MADADVIKAEVQALRDDVGEIKGLMQKVADALERLARLEERHATVSSALERAFSSISKIEARVRTLELAQPVQKLTSGWVTNGVWAAAGMAAMFLLKHGGVL